MTSRDLKGQTRDPNTLIVQYLENSCYLETILPSLLWGSMVSYPSDRLASCLLFDLFVPLTSNHLKTITIELGAPKNPKLDTNIIKLACLGAEI